MVQKLLDWGAEVNQLQIDTEVCVSEILEHYQPKDRYDLTCDQVTALTLAAQRGWLEVLSGNVIAMP